MFAQRLARTLRSVTSRRNLSAFDNKNTIQQKRQQYYTRNTAGAEHPTYLKEPADKVIFAVATAGCLFGVVNIFAGLINMSFGINKLK